MNICVCGYYGMGNFGDELFLETFRQRLKGHTVFPWAPYTDPSRIDAVIIGGGDLVTPYKFNSFYFPPELAQLPLWVYGIGIVDYYPMETWPEAEVERHRSYLGRARRLSLRDERSADIARKLGWNATIDTVPDIAFGMRQPDYPIRRFSARPVIGLCIFAYPNFPTEKIVALCVEWCREGYAVALLPVVNQSNNPYADALLCEEVKQGIRQSYAQADVMLPGIQYDLKVTYSYLQSVDLLVSFKLHPALVALRGGVPTLCLTKMSKVRSLFEAYSLERFVLDYELPAESIAERFSELVADGRAAFDAAGPELRRTEQRSSESLESLLHEMEEVTGRTEQAR